MKQVVIDVLNGRAEVAHTSPGVSVTIVDRDSTERSGSEMELELDDAVSRARKADKAAPYLEIEPSIELFSEAKGYNYERARRIPDCFVVYLVVGKRRVFVNVFRAKDKAEQLVADLQLLLLP